jgi:hypothetical protein
MFVMPALAGNPQGAVPPRMMAQPPVTAALVTEPSPQINLGSYSSAVANRFKPANSIFDAIFDFGFKRYVTPLIVRFHLGTGRDHGHALDPFYFVCNDLQLHARKGSRAASSAIRHRQVGFCHEFEDDARCHGSIYDHTQDRLDPLFLVVDSGRLGKCDRDLSHGSIDGFD